MPDLSSYNLAPMQEKYVLEYLADPSDQGKAAIRAGYAPKASVSKASQLMSMPKIKTAIQDFQRESVQDIGVTPERILKELRDIAFANLKDILIQDADGNTTVDLSKLDPSKASSMSELVVKNTKGKKDVKIKLNDKITALVTLGKHLGMFREQIDIKATHSLEKLIEQSFLGDIIDSEVVEPLLIENS